MNDQLKSELIILREEKRKAGQWKGNSQAELLQLQKSEQEAKV